MSEQGLPNCYLLKFENSGVVRTLAVQKVKDQQNEFEIIPKREDQTDISQLWIYYPESILLRNLKYPECVLADDKTDEFETDSKIVVKSQISQMHDNPTDFYFRDGKMLNSTLRKAVIYNNTEDTFILAADYPTTCTFNRIEIDVTNYALDSPPYYVPIAILFSEAAQEYAITLDTTSHLNEQGRPLKREPFKFGVDPRQYWFYIPILKHAFYSCAERNQVIDDMSNNDQFESTVYTHLHHGKPNQQWKVENRNIVGKAHEKVITYIEKDPTSFRMKSRSENVNGIQLFYFCPCFTPIAESLPITRVYSDDDSIRFGMSHYSAEEEEVQDYYNPNSGEDDDDDDDGDDDETDDLNYSDSSF
ncbi:hypothetical protein TVAG_045140 [Trichomonas vaginalis G3]|uniref:Ricin B lectin domain-containing protein n=1 Tax=Trichomonas vaginalis (strain ATCC PRA-98 / G3) TaxID=412133 RepID=A2E8G2_TRIV3|nr:Ricin B-like lectins family [Trichomonas vaginalis G3]EAY11090.1 hypothetical protein TVAG_045140 [Trichomonas vaginalis G3]KAI5520450.1 Ricin B-like lectins family [Trichomonas vaginalis G3]|eukprot:XP_001323313.1 hypothetical protein [Trichomonas vaginalis G3]